MVKRYVKGVAAFGVADAGDGSRQTLDEDPFERRGLAWRPIGRPADPVSVFVVRLGERLAR